MRATSSWTQRLWTCTGLLAACTGPQEGVGGVRHQAPPPTAAATGFSITRVEKVDLLFVVDNSDSMEDEQASLRAQLPHLMDVLTRGERGPDDPRPFTPVRDLHVGVVSTDMGIPGVEFSSGSCHADGGDDGRLQHTPHPDPAHGLACDAAYPPYLTYDASQDPAQLAHDFACVAALDRKSVV
jgi:hypothetical protein